MRTFIFGPCALVFCVIVLLRWRELRALPPNGSAEGTLCVRAFLQFYLCAEAAYMGNSVRRMCQRGAQSPVSSSVALLVVATPIMFFVPLLVSLQPTVFVSFLKLLYCATLLVVVHLVAAYFMLRPSEFRVWLTFFCIVNVYPFLPGQAMYLVCARESFSVCDNVFLLIFLHSLFACVDAEDVRGPVDQPFKSRVRIVS